MVKKPKLPRLDSALRACPPFCREKGCFGILLRIIAYSARSTHSRDSIRPRHGHSSDPQSASNHHAAAIGVAVSAAKLRSPHRKLLHRLWRNSFCRIPDVSSLFPAVSRQVHVQSGAAAEGHRSDARLGRIGFSTGAVNGPAKHCFPKPSCRQRNLIQVFGPGLPC